MPDLFIVTIRFALSLLSTIFNSISNANIFPDSVSTSEMSQSDIPSITFSLFSFVSSLPLK